MNRKKPMNRKNATLISAFLALVTGGSVLAEDLNVDNWENFRPQGLTELQHIYSNFMGVNAQDVFPLKDLNHDYTLHEIPSVVRALRHPAVSAFVVMKDDGTMLMEQYANGNSRDTVFSAQSATKSFGYLLLNDALVSGKIDLNDKIETHIPNIGPGYHDRTVGDVAAMSVNHNVAELAAYAGDPEAFRLYKESDAIFGFARNDAQMTLEEYVPQVQVGPGGSTVWKGDIANYASINTNVVTLAIQNATGKPAADIVRRILHKVGGEHSVYMLTDFSGLPMLSGGMALRARDMARYTRLLIEDKERVLKDREAAFREGGRVPPEIMFVESRYYKSAIHNEYGIGHSGWGGQVVFADPESGAVVVIHGQTSSRNAAPNEYYNMAYEAIYDIIKHVRAQSDD